MGPGEIQYCCGNLQNKTIKTFILHMRISGCGETLPSTNSQDQIFILSENTLSIQQQA